uniref:CHK domain-containing protein n=1 Tax=Strongyloides papillosus TaxID=174720 RepID=A0A0N5CCS7_STREA
MQDLKNTFIGKDKFSYQWVFENLLSEDEEFQKFLSFDDNSNKKAIVKASSFDLSNGKGCFSEVFKVTFVANDGSSYNTILKIPGSSHFNEAVNKSILIDDNGNKFESNESMQKTVVQLHNRECEFYNMVKFTDCPLPKVFKAVQWEPSSNSHGCLLMRDLGVKAKMQSFSESLTPGQVMNVVEIIAKLHAFTIKNIDRIKGYNMKFPYFSKDADSIVDTQIKKLKTKFPDMFGDLFERFLPYVSNEKFSKYVTVDCHTNFNIPALLSHGDIWTNNIYFKIDNNGCISNEVEALLDWQILNLGNPTLDIARLLMVSVNADIRHQYHDAFFDHYYNILTKELGDIPQPFSLEDFKKCYKFSQLFQTRHTILMISIFTNYIPKEDKNTITQKYKEEILMLRLKQAIEDGVHIIENDLKDFEYDF